MDGLLGRASGSNAPQNAERTRPITPNGIATLAVPVNSSRTLNSIFGYHNTYHLHAQPSLPPVLPPPSYDATRIDKRPRSSSDVLPQYECSVRKESPLGLRCELLSPFLVAAPAHSLWQDVYAVLRGTSFRIYRFQGGTHRALYGKVRKTWPGKLIRAYSMQHAEVGLATDVKKSDLVPKTALGRLIPPSARQKFYETDPSMFQPVREHIVRVRMETEQFLLCAQTQEEMLDWVEALSVAIDIAMPIEDRSEPRYRSLPRRTQRQRELDGRTSVEARLSNPESRRGLVEQQERIMRELYPHLATDTSPNRESIQAAGHERNLESLDSGASMLNSDPDVEDLDREDAIVSTISHVEPIPGSTEIESRLEGQTRTANMMSQEGGDAGGNEDPTNPTPLVALSPSPSLASCSNAHLQDSQLITTIQQADAKNNRWSTPQLSPSAALRYRRRCAPVLLASSPRASDVIIAPVDPLAASRKNANELDRGAGAQLRRVKMDLRKQWLIPFETLPPRYDAHGFVSPPRHVAIATSFPAIEVAEDTHAADSSSPGLDLEPATALQHLVPTRPTRPVRGLSKASVVTTRSTTSAASIDANASFESLSPSASPGNELTPPITSTDFSRSDEPLTTGAVRLRLNLDGADADIMLSPTRPPLTLAENSSDSSNEGSLLSGGPSLAKSVSSESQTSQDAKAVMKRRRQTFQARIGLLAKKPGVPEGRNVDRSSLSASVVKRENGKVNQVNNAVGEMALAALLF